MQVKLYFFVALILLIGGIFLVSYAVVMQLVLCYEKFGFITDVVFIPHKSAFGFLGVIPAIIGMAMFEID